MANKGEKPETAPEVAEEPMAKQSGFKIPFRKLSMTAGLIVAIFIFGSIALVTTLAVVVHTNNIRASRAEYDYLREVAEEIKIESEEFGVIRLSALDEEMRQINPDYVCWIRIEGTSIDYPVVRGNDNIKYLNISFHGDESITGTVFMDYRNVGDFLSPYIEGSLRHIIIYGHNLQQGGIFSELRRFLNREFLEENRIITLIVDDQTIEFEIFSARQTDINDPAYFLNFSESHSFPRFANRIEAPMRATQIITLSTCISDGSDDARLIVQGYRLLD